MTRSEFISTVSEAILKDRNATHGEPEKSFDVIADLWTVWLTSRGVLADGACLTPSDVCALQALLKLGRISLNPFHEDSWVDVAGYAGCGVEVLGPPGPVIVVNSSTGEISRLFPKAPTH